MDTTVLTSPSLSMRLRSSKRASASPGLPQPSPGFIDAPTVNVMALRAISNSLPSSAARPISPVEFAKALFQVWGEQQRREHEERRRNTFGLAISGGVDSMALAALFTDLKQSVHEVPVSMLQPHLPKGAAAVLRDLKFKAFIVDHGVRNESASEAESVSSVLEQRGIRTQILKIDWGSHSRPESLANFESLARKYRFQALGKACRDSGIDSLFLAHHQDDQAETVLMRLINGHRGFGLRGIKRAGEIPECHGIHGVHESSEHLEKSLQLSPSPSKQLAMAIETGGVRIYRPLLKFGKNRLRGTCEEADIKWFEDYTNKDPTVTLRNAVRNMYNCHAMPAALAAPSVIKLSEAFESKYQKLSRIADSYFKLARKTFEPRSGRMLIVIPDLKDLNCSLSPRDTSLVAALFLLQAIQYVTPEEHTNLASLNGPVSRIFTEHRDSSPYQAPAAFTISGVYFQPLCPPNAGEGADNVIWSLSRQLYMAGESENQHIHVHRTERHGWSPWTLFDGRFWIRLQNQSGKEVTVRPLQKNDRERYMSRNRDKAYHYHYPDALLKRLAPGTVRWTLPVIVVKAKDGLEDILAFPTLNWSLPGFNSNEVNWEVRYKKVDIENLGSGLS